MDYSTDSGSGIRLDVNNGLRNHANNAPHGGKEKHLYLNRLSIGRILLYVLRTLGHKLE